jgi:dihydroxy-acid dehydratase
MTQHQEFRFDYSHRAIFKAMGFTTKELSQPRIAVVNSWGEGSPGHVHLRWALKGKGIKDIAIVMDGRFSGFTTSYVAIGHICPEAQVGGPLALLKDGDRIHVDIPNRRLDAKLSEEEMERRRAAWVPPIPPNLPGFANLYGRLALQADQGAGWPVRWEDFDRG